MQQGWYKDQDTEGWCILQQDVAEALMILSEADRENFLQPEG